MDFREIANSKILFLLCATVICFIIFQSVIFIYRAWKFGLAINMKKSDMKKVLVSSATFTILPSTAIVAILLVLIKKLGLYFPWLRLSVVGSGFYESIAAETAMKAVTNLKDVNGLVMTKEIFVAAMWVMTIGIIWGPLYTALGSKSIQKGVEQIKKKNPKFFLIIMSTLFLSMLLTFSRKYLMSPILFFKNHIITKSETPFISVEMFMSFVPLLVMIIAGISFSIIIKIANSKKSLTLKEFAFPISLVSGMVSAIILTEIIKGV